MYVSCKVKGLHTKQINNIQLGSASWSQLLKGTNFKSRDPAQEHFMIQKYYSFYTFPLCSPIAHPLPRAGWPHID